jgi:alpha-L-fucosidase 2
VLPSRSTTHGFNNALNANFAGGMWVGGAGWAAHFFYDYYLYTGDRKFLAEHALPFMEKAALFFEDYLYEGPDGRYVDLLANPVAGEHARQLELAGLLQRHHGRGGRQRTAQQPDRRLPRTGRNEDKIPVWQQMLDKMPDYMIDDNGIIKEWLTPRLGKQRQPPPLLATLPAVRRHAGRDCASPELRAAFRKSIEYKLDKHWKNNQRGFMSFGLVQLGQAATSLGEGELAYHCLTHLVNRFWLNNLASMHNHRSLFNMDISGGMPAVIIKMLVASDPGRLQLLQTSDRGRASAPA